MEQAGKFGSYLVASGFVQADWLAEAVEIQKVHPFLRIGEILVSLGAIAFPTLIEALREYRAQCKLGQLLVLEGAITNAQLEDGLRRQAETGFILGKVLIDMGACSFDQVMNALAIQRSNQAASA